jgi:hypothetical protein
MSMNGRNAMVLSNCDSADGFRAVKSATAGLLGEAGAEAETTGRVGLAGAWYVGDWWIISENRSDDSGNQSRSETPRLEDWLLCVLAALLHSK